MTEETKMKEPWEMTVSEWEGLPLEEKNEFIGEHPPYPYHSNFHLMSVIDAIKRKERVPSEVLDSFGKNTALEQALKDATSGIVEFVKEPWEMTQKEIIDQARKSKGWSTKTNSGWKSKSFTGVVSEHRAAIKEALKEGKPVSAEVLEFYPELLKPEVDVKRGDKVVVQGLKDTYEGVVVSVRDNNFTLRTPQFVKMQWGKNDIIQIIPGEETEEIGGGGEPKPNRIRRHSKAGVGYLK